MFLSFEIIFIYFCKFPNMECRVYRIVVPLEKKISHTGFSSATLVCAIRDTNRRFEEGNYYESYN